MFLPKGYQYEASMLIRQMNTPQQYQRYEEPFIPAYQQPIYETVQPEFVSTRRRTRITRQVRPPQPVQPASPVVNVAPKTRRRGYVEEEPEPDTLPVSERPSEAAYRQFLQLLDLYDKVGAARRGEA